MKSYIVYIDGLEEGVIKARTHNEAEALAQWMFPDFNDVSVAYTEE
jgi:hypothetical protein